MKRIALVLLALTLACSGEKKTPIVVGSKNFTESVILGELVAQKLENAQCSVERRLNMGGTFVCDKALTAGSLDTYVEYSGTALTAIFNQPVSSDRTAVRKTISAAYSGRGLAWGPELGFNNTFAMIVRKSDAEKFALRSISDLIKVQDKFRPGFGYEFVERPDGWKGLLAHYSLSFREESRTMDLGLTYKALANGEVDLIAGNSTDGLIDSLGLVVLSDDRRYFPPYDAGIVRRSDIDRTCGGASKALDSLAGRIDDATMRKLNFEVDGKKRDVAEVVKEFLARH
jgi:glycine betaine/choline ABC-type transport system substrate-binding protein